MAKANQGQRGLFLQSALPLIQLSGRNKRVIGEISAFSLRAFGAPKSGGLVTAFSHDEADEKQERKDEEV